MNPNMDLYQRFIAALAKALSNELSLDGPLTCDLRWISGAGVRGGLSGHVYVVSDGLPYKVSVREVPTTGEDN